LLGALLTSAGAVPLDLPHQYVPAMRNTFLASALLMLCAITSTANSASFNCKKAGTEVEKKICADARLSRLDDELAETYRAAMTKMAQVERARLRRDQATWLKSRNACKDDLCIEVMYRTRKAVLTMAVAPESAEERTSASTEYGRFWLTYGHGVKVCEAYLQRLSSSAYEHHPKCDRPESDEVSGFRSLDRMKLTAEAMLPFWASVESFLESGDPERWRAADASDRKLGRPLQYGDRPNQLRRLQNEASFRRPFRFARPVDIDNDGIADPVVIWRTGSCVRSGALDEMHYWASIPIVLNAEGDGPNVERTRRIFGHPLGGYRLPSGKVSSKFRPIGRHMGIFEFEAAYYMDTFFDGWGDFNGHRQHDAVLGEYDPDIAKRLAVFKRSGGETRQLCEYWLQDVSESGVGALRQ
jgi:uncharacterized protein YecT (DUF1311 family)